MPPVNGVLLDLGLSSDQLADRERGFSFEADGPLDLRFDPDEGEPAAALVNRLRESELADLIYQLGEERFTDALPGGSSSIACSNASKQQNNLPKLFAGQYQDRLTRGVSTRPRVLFSFANCRQ